MGRLTQGTFHLEVMRTFPKSLVTEMKISRRYTQVLECNREFGHIVKDFKDRCKWLQYCIELYAVAANDDSREIVVAEVRQDIANIRRLRRLYDIEMAGYLSYLKRKEQEAEKKKEATRRYERLQAKRCRSGKDERRESDTDDDDDEPQPLSRELQKLMGKIGGYRNRK